MSYVIGGDTGDWEVVVGLEVHAQIISRAKLFSGAATDFGAEPNTQVSLVDAAFPGMLPVINGYLRRTGGAHRPRAQRGRSTWSRVFERKNYFYPDLPAGYQISQYQQPLVGEGTTVTVDLADGSDQVTSASSACTWSRTPASRCTTRIRGAPSSTSTAPASR